MDNPILVAVLATLILAMYLYRPRWHQALNLELVHQFDSPSQSSLDKPRIVGVTSLHGNIYVIRAQTYDVHVYSTASFELVNVFYVSGLVSAADVTSCSLHRKIYIADDSKDKIFRISEPNFEHRGRQLRSRVWSVGCSPTGLTVSSEFNIVVACLGSGFIKQFTRYGQLVSSHHVIDTHPFHVISLTDRYVIVGYSDDHVCAQYLQGKKHSIKYIEQPNPPHIIWSFGANMTSSTPVDPSTYVTECHIPAPPTDVIVVDGLLLYNDNTKHCLQKLDLSTLARMGQLKRPESPHHRITRLWYDELTRRIFAADVYGKINVYDVSYA